MAENAGEDIVSAVNCYSTLTESAPDFDNKPFCQPIRRKWGLEWGDKERKNNQVYVHERSAR